MAALIRISVTPSAILLNHQNQKPAPIKRCTRVVAHSTSNEMNLRTTPLLQIRSSSIKLHKVFEDRSSGIVCYRDEKGEITCEGYDEGPRFHHMFSAFTSDQRDAEVIELVHRRLLEIVDKSQVKHSGGDKDDVKSNSNGFYS